MPLNVPSLRLGIQCPSLKKLKLKLTETSTETETSTDENSQI